MEILPGIHRIECPIGPRYVALYLIVGDNYTLLLDTGFDQSIRETLVPYMKANSLALDKVRYAINTHSDYDHTGGNKAVKELMPNSLICCGERDRAMIVDLSKMIDDRYNEFANEHGFSESQDAIDFIGTVAFETPIDIGFAGGERIDLGNRFVQILHTPGHSWGHLSILDEKTGAIMIGDAVLGQSVLLATGEHAFPPTYRFVEAYRATIRMIKGLNPTEILTSHYPRYIGQGGIDFLDISLSYTDLVESVTLETLAKSSAPISLLEIIEFSHDRLGIWPDPVYKYLVYPVLGALEVLVSYGKVTKTFSPGGTALYK
jgi:glyoxylase-like metal-dependent hydrolase (beta-lactamase superfamily II)